jgi:hypothetical protein
MNSDFSGFNLFPILASDWWFAWWINDMSGLLLACQLICRVWGLNLLIVLKRGLKNAAEDI